MTDTTIGSADTPQRATENTSTEQQTSSNDAATSRRNRKQTPADKFKQVNDLITGALTPDAVTRVTDDTSSDDDDDTGTQRPTDAPSARQGGDGDDAGATQEPPASSPITSLTDIADKLGVKVKDLYDIEVPLKGGEGTIKLGALKDAHQDNQIVRQEVAQRAVELDEREMHIVNEQRLWSQLGQELTKALTPQTRDALADRLQHRQATERQALLSAMPELRDADKFSAFRDEVVETLSRYGFKPHEIAVDDHRQLLVVRDLARAQKRLKELREFKPTPKTPNSVASQGRKTRGSNVQHIVNNARHSKHPSDKTQAVAALIKGA